MLVHAEFLCISDKAEVFADFDCLLSIEEVDLMTNVRATLVKFGMQLFLNQSQLMYFRNATPVLFYFETKLRVKVLEFLINNSLSSIILLNFYYKWFSEFPLSFIPRTCRCLLM